MANTSLTFPRETVEFLPLAVTDAGANVTAFETAVLPYKSRPVPNSWTAAVTVAGEHGLMLTNLSPGTYGIWVRITASPETVVVSPSDEYGAGYINIT